MLFSDVCVCVCFCACKNCKITDHKLMHIGRNVYYSWVGFCDIERWAFTLRPVLLSLQQELLIRFCCNIIWQHVGVGSVISLLFRCIFGARVYRRPRHGVRWTKFCGRLPASISPRASLKLHASLIPSSSKSLASSQTSVSLSDCSL